MGVWGSNFRWGYSRYKDLGDSPVNPAPPQTSVGMTGGNVASFTLAILPTQGFVFSENSGDDFVVPFVGCAGFPVIDSDNNERHIVVDIRTRKCYDIATKKGPDNTTQVQRWKDKQNADGTGGTDIIPRVRFFDDLGTYENFTLKNAINHIFGRCTNKDNRGAEGFDSEGFLTGTEWTLRLYANGERLVAERTANDIPLISDITFNGNDQEHRFAIELEANKSGHMITGRKSEYIVLDKMSGSGISTENTVVDELADTIAWYSRRPTGILPSGNGSIINRNTGLILDEVNAGSTATAAPPANLGGYSLYCNDSIYLPAGAAFLLFLGKYVDSVMADSTSLTLVEHDTYDGWTIYSVTDIPAYTNLTIRHGGSPGMWVQAYDIRLFSSPRSAAALAFYVDNIQNHFGDVVLP